MSEGENSTGTTAHVHLYRLSGLELTANTTALTQPNPFGDTLLEPPLPLQNKQLSKQEVTGKEENKQSCFICHIVISRSVQLELVALNRNLINGKEPLKQGILTVFTVMSRIYSLALDNQYY